MMATRREAGRLPRAGAAWRWSAVLALLVGVLGGWLPGAGVARAATLAVPCDVAALVAAVGDTNNDVLNLAAGCTYTLTASNNEADGPNGLPDIARPLTINGNGAIIERSAADGTPFFRLIHVAADGNLALNHLTLRGGRAGDGADDGIYAIAGQPGGGAFNLGTLTVADSTVSNNRSGDGGSFNGDDANGGSGGGLASEGTLTVIRSTISGNSTGSGHSYLGGCGGGIASEGTALTVVNSTISGNSTSTDGCGGGINNGSFGPATLINSIITDNDNPGTVGYRGGGVSNFLSTLTLVNTIIAGNRDDGSDTSANADCFQFVTGQMTSSGHNLVGSGTGCPSNGAGDQTVAPANVGTVFGPLADNGGPTRTHALLPGSPAIDAGDNAVCAASPVNNIDQRGVPRPQGAGCDVGAYELLVAPVPTLAALQPGTAPVGSADTTLVLLGTGFTPPPANGGSIVQFNGTALATTYLSPTQLVATIPAALLATAGSFPVTVTTPSPGGGTSNALPFVVAAPPPSPSPTPTPTPSPVPSAALAPASLTFGAQTVGITSATQPATLTNTGTVPLAINVITVSGDFAQANDCPASLPVGMSCTIAVSFTPAVAGSRAGVLSVFDDASGSPQNVALSGTGVAPASPSPTPLTFTVAAAATGQGSITPMGTTPYAAGTVATYSATPAAGQTFTGWTLDGQYVGYASPLTLTVEANRTLVASFVATPQFGDLGTLSAQDRQAVTFLAALGIVNPQGVNGSGQFQPTSDVNRAQVAAFVARTFGWQREFHRNSFPDKCDAAGNCVDDELWNNVAALADYGVIGGYTDGATCQSASTTAPCYLPRDVVQRVQIVSVVARAFTRTPALRPTGFWDRLPANTAQYTNVPNVGTQRSDLTTYRANVGTVPGQTSDANFNDPSGNGTRLYLIQALYAAFNSVYGADRVP